MTETSAQVDVRDIRKRPRFNLNGGIPATFSGVPASVNEGLTDIWRPRTAALLLILAFGTAQAQPAQTDGEFGGHGPWPDGSTVVALGLVSAAEAEPDVSVVASLVGDRDDFGFNGRPKSCSSFDNRTPDDHPAFDVSAPGGTAQGCQFEGSWTHTFAVPPEGVAHFAIRIPEIMADDSRFGCNYQNNAERMTLDGVPAPGFLPAGPSCTATTIYKRSFWGQQANAIAGDGVIDVWYTQGGDEFALDYSEIIDVWAPVEIRPVSGDGQTGVIGSPIDLPLEVELVTSDPAILKAKVPITFELIGPNGSSGGGLTSANGSPDAVGPATYTAYADANGRAGVRVVLGDKAGQYVVRARSGMSLSDTPVDFVLTARKPASVRIIKDAPETAYLENSYAVSGAEPTTFFAVGLDAAGNRIGTVRSTWSVKSGRPAGGGTLLYDATFPTSTNRLTPVTAGRVDLSAKPVVKGVQTASTSLYIVGVVLSLSGDVTQNHIWSFVPGSTLNGSSMPLPANPSDPIQRVNLFIQTGTSRKGQIAVALEQVSTYPGVAMNYPLGSQDFSPDLTLSSLADMTVEKSTIPAEPFAADGVSAFILNVRDYAAAGKLRVMIANGRDEFTLEQQVPIDKNGNGLPDAGWRAGTITVPDLGMDPGWDEDNNPSMLWPMPDDGGALGDNLTNFEEYRGFLIRGEHRRTNPFKKDYFIDASELDGDIRDAYPTLPTATHSIDPENRTELDVINPNYYGLPGSQRHVDQAAPLVVLDFAPSRNLGDTVCIKPYLSDPKVPNYCRRITIYMQEIHEVVADLAAGDPAAELKLRRFTLLHEAAHAVNLYHNDGLQCVMYDGKITDVGLDNLPVAFCQGFSGKVYCETCGGDYPFEKDVTNFDEVETLRVRH